MATVETSSSFTMPSLPHGKAEHQQGSLPPCSDHRDGATAWAGISGSPIGITVKTSLVLSSLLVLLLMRLVAGATEISSPPACQVPASPSQYHALLSWTKAESCVFLPLKLAVKIHMNLKFFKHLLLILLLFTLKSISGLISEINRCMHSILLLQLNIHGNPVPYCQGFLRLRFVFFIWQVCAWITEIISYSFQC